MPLVVKLESEAVIFWRDTLLPVPPQIKFYRLDSKQLIGWGVDETKLQVRKVWWLTHHSNCASVAVLSGKKMEGIPEWLRSMSYRTSYMIPSFCTFLPGVLFAIRTCALDASLFWPPLYGLAWYSYPEDTQSHQQQPSQQLCQTVRSGSDGHFEKRRKVQKSI